MTEAIERTINDWENLRVLQRNREPAHATSVPFADAETALMGERGASSRFKLLNGDWQFCYAASPACVPRGFEQESYVLDAWPTLPVPSNWQMHGYGTPQYTNVALPVSGRSAACAAAEPGRLLSPHLHHARGMGR